MYYDIIDRDIVARRLVVLVDYYVASHMPGAISNDVGRQALRCDLRLILKFWTTSRQSMIDRSQLLNKLGALDQWWNELSHSSMYSRSNIVFIAS